MNYTITLIFFVFLIRPIHAQKNNDFSYFPQEQLIHPDCTDTTATNSCLISIIREQLSRILASKSNNLTKTQKDTLVIEMVFNVNKKGSPNPDRQWQTSNDTIINKTYKKDFKALFKTLPRFKVLHRKSKKYTSIHRLKFKYLIHKSTLPISFTPLLPEEETYMGAFIEEAPLFPGCTRNKGDQETRICFNKMMQKHIAKNFRYPEAAQKNGIQGRVSIIFTIDAEGNTRNLRMKSPHPLLAEEAERIIKRLPQFKPAMQNGVPVRIPFSIPITFKLR